MTLYRDQRVISIALEATEGTDPFLTGAPAAISNSLVAAAARDLEEFAHNLSEEPIPRSRVTSEQPGSRSISSRGHVKPALKAFISMKTISDADADDLPEHGIYLQASGCKLLSDAATKSHTFQLTSGQGKTCTIYEWLNNADKSRSILTRSHRNRGTAKLIFEAGKPDIIECNWIGTQPNAQTPTEPQSSAFTTAYDLDAEPKMKFNLSRWHLINLDDSNAIYGGGDLATPGYDGDLLRVEIDFARNPQPRVGATASDGIHGATLDLQQAMVKFTMELNDYSRINLQRSSRLRHAFELDFIGSQPGRSGNTRQGVCYLSLRSVNDRQIGGGLYLAECEGELIFPASIGGSYVAGQRPGAVIGSGTNRGLVHNPTGLEAALLYLQYATA